MGGMTEDVLEGQINIFEYLEDITPIKYGDRGCRVCQWYVDDRCRWSGGKLYGDKYPDCIFIPDEYTVPNMCANCEYANQFHYEVKEEYIPTLKNGYSRKAADDPKETPDIYCTHPEGSLNRRTAYKDREESGFGVGHWNRQHEFDTCDR